MKVGGLRVNLMPKNARGFKDFNEKTFLNRISLKGSNQNAKK